MKPDVIMADVRVEDYDAIVFVGAVENQTHYGNNPQIHQILHEALEQGKVVASICNSTQILVKAGILEGKQATTVEPAKKCHLLEEAGATCTRAPVQRDGQIVTAQGPDAVQDFALAVLEAMIEMSIPPNE